MTGGRTRGDLVRTGIRGVGQLLITLGLIVLLLVVYELWVTNIFAAAKQSAVHKKFAQEIQSGHNDPLKGQDRLTLPAGKQVVLPAGQGFANLYIPALGQDYAYTIVEGTTTADLERGPGHYTGTAVPGQLGNFALAGHRVTKGQPFLNINELRPGDPVVVQTVRYWYVYDVLGDKKTKNLGAVDAQGVPGREIVAPTDGGVIAPVPDHPGATVKRALMTMTTCNPKYSASQRMVVHAVLARAVRADGAQTPRELGGVL